MQTQDPFRQSVFNRFTEMITSKLDQEYNGTTLLDQLKQITGGNADVFQTFPTPQINLSALKIPQDLMEILSIQIVGPPGVGHSHSVEEKEHPAKKKKVEIPIQATGEYKCDFSECGKVLPSPKALELHSNVHTDKYRCQKCGKGHTGLGNLKSHERIHIGVKPFKCDFEKCNRSFSQKGGLINHRHLHFPDTLFRCEACNKTFIQQSSLTVHRRTHTGEKPFSCDTCGKLFNQKGDLHKHKNVHSHVKPFACNKCEKPFSTQSDLKRHEYTHADVRPFACKVANCGKTFSREIYLRSHENVEHGGVKLFECSKCGFSHKTTRQLYACHKNHTDVIKSTVQ